MAKIQEYQPEVGAPGPVGAVSPNLGEVDAVGNALQNVGGAIDKASDVFLRKNQQKETTDAYSTFAQARADFNTRVAQEGKDGTLDPDKVMSDYNDFVDNQSGNYSTAVGQNYANRQAARLKSSLQQKASSTYAQMTGQQSANQIELGDNANMQAIFQNPDQLVDILHGQHEFLDAAQQAGGVPPAVVDKAKKNSSYQYSLAAVRGMATTSPDAAQKMLDSGQMLQFLDNAGMNQAQEIVDHARRASDAQSKANDKADQDAKQVASENAMTNYMSSAVAGKTVDLQKVINDPDVDPKDAQNVVSFILKMSVDLQEPRGPVMASYTKRLLSPDNADGHIGSMQQLVQDGASGKINLAEFNKLKPLLGKTEDDKQLNGARKLVYEAAHEQILKASTLGGNSIRDPDGYANLQAFQSQQQQAEASYLANKRSLVGPGGLYDPKNPDNPINNIKSPSYQEVMGKIAAKQFQGKIGAPASPPPANQFTAPGVPPTVLPAKTSSDGVRKPGETPDEFLKRTKGPK